MLSYFMNSNLQFSIIRYRTFTLFI